MRRRIKIGLGIVVGAAVVTILLIPVIRSQGVHHHSLHGVYLRRVADGAISYYQSEFARPDGTILPPMLVDSAPPVGDPCGPPEQPKGPHWAALRFGDPPKRLQVTYEKTAPDAFVVRAHGDVDCDGIYSTFERRCALGADDTFACRQLEMHAEE